MVHTIARGARRRLVNEHNGRAWLAWNTVALGRVPRRLPSLKSLMVEADDRGKARTWQQQLAIARQMTGP